MLLENLPFSVLNGMYMEEFISVAPQLGKPVPFISSLVMLSSASESTSLVSHGGSYGGNRIWQQGTISFHFMSCFVLLLF